MLRPLLVALVLSAVALAGCSSSSPSPDPVVPGGFEPTKDTGIIHGVIVDAAIRPVPGASITARGTGDPLTATSDEAGFFGFEGLAPGTWFLSASKLGYEPAQQSVDVVAAEADPPIVKILLLENPALRPYSETFPWRGFIQCSAGAPGASINPCFLSPDSSNVHEMNVSKVPSFVQAEMVWKPATAVGTSFLLSSFVPAEDIDDFDGVDDFAEVEGESPLILRIEGDLLANKSVGDGQPLAFRVFPGQGEPTVFTNQAFDVYITVFYGYKPPAEWSFIVDGTLDPNDS